MGYKPTQPNPTFNIISKVGLYKNHIYGNWVTHLEKYGNGLKFKFSMEIWEFVIKLWDFII